MLKFIKDHGMEGAVAKRADRAYQPGQRTGLWSKYRVNLGQEFVVGGYVPSHLGVDSLVVGSTVARTSFMHPGEGWSAACNAA
jgi:ATP-dependent DNA ligase